MRRPEALNALLEAANEQGGYVSVAQAIRLGLAHSDIERLERGGDLQRVRRGVYRMRHAQSHREDEIAAFLLLQRGQLPWESRQAPRAVVSHDSAAAIHRLGTIIPERPTFTVPQGTTTTTAGDVEVHHMRLRKEDWSWERDEALSLPVTTPARTIVDLVLAKAEPSYVLRATREALSRQQTTPEQLLDTARHRKSRSRAVQARVSELIGEAA